MTGAGSAGHSLGAAAACDACRDAETAPFRGILARRRPIAFPVALGFLLFRHAGLGSSREALLLVGTGPVTVAPLLLFGHAVTRVPLSTLGLLQYIGPTITFICGHFLAPEPIPWHRAALLGTVWLAIIVYIYDSIKNRPTK